MLLSYKNKPLKNLLFSGGILAFLLIEKIFQFTEEDDSEKPDEKKKGKKLILGYLNLAANCIDNFLHGLTVASRWDFIYNGYRIRGYCERFSHTLL